MVLGNSSFFLSGLSIFFLCALETLVCIVQGYVFFTLLSMYLNE
jgi:F0F1-type ATP synthase membrane subunit a